MELAYNGHIWKYLGYVSILLVMYLPTISKAQTCVDGTSYIGYDDISNKHDQALTNNEANEFMFPHDSSAAKNVYSSTCCGKISSFDIWIKASGTITFQIWTPIAAPTNWILTGEYLATVTNTAGGGGEQVNVAVPVDLFMNPGDHLGWKNSGTEIVAYHRCQSAADIKCQEFTYHSAAGPAVGGNVFWADDIAENRGYAVKGWLAERPSATCTNAEAQWSDTTPLLTNIVTVIPQVPPFSSGVAFSLNNYPALFIIDPTTGVIQNIATLPATYPSTFYVIEVQIIDACANPSTCYVSVNVSFTNYPISIDNLPNVVYIHEDTVIQTNLFTVNTSDANVGDYATCSVNSTVPASGPFFAQRTAPLDTSLRFNIYSSTSPGFSYLDNMCHTVKVQCDDLYGSSATGDLSVCLEPNLPPTFPSTSVSMCVSAKTITSGDVVYTWVATDPESDTITYNLTSVVPSNGPFHCSTIPLVVCVATEARLFSTQTLLTWDTQPYVLTYYAFDGRNTVGPLTLSICITGLNTRGVLNNLPFNKLIPETEPSMTTLYEVGKTDPDIGDTYVFSMSVEPLAYAYLFTFDTSSGLLRLSSAQQFDFEGPQPNSFNITFACHDGIHPCVSNEVLYVTIFDVNEAPAFDRAVYSASALEGTAGTLIASGYHVVTDPDIYSTESQTFAITGGDTDGYFSIDSNTGDIYLAREYDIDSFGVASRTEVLTLTVYDKDGLTDTAIIRITIGDTNDNRPVFANASYVIYVNANTSMGVDLLAAFATDADSGINGQFTYSILGSSLGLGNQYFQVGSTTGRMQLKKLIDYADGTTFTMTLVAEDQGKVPSSLQGYATVTVIYPSITPTTVPPTTIDTPCFFCTTGGIAVFSMLMGISAALLGLGVYALWKYCIQPLNLKLKPFCSWSKFRKWFRRGNRKPRPKLQPPPKKPKEQKPIKIKSKPEPKRAPSPPPPPQKPAYNARDVFWSTTDRYIDKTNPNSGHMNWGNI